MQDGIRTVHCNNCDRIFDSLCYKSSKKLECPDCGYMVPVQETFLCKIHFWFYMYMIPMLLHSAFLFVVIYCVSFINGEKEDIKKASFILKNQWRRTLRKTEEARLKSAESQATDA